MLHDWCNKGCCKYYPLCGVVHINDPLLLIRKISLCNGGNRFPLSLSEWSSTICHITINKTFPSFLPLLWFIFSNAWCNVFYVTISRFLLWMCTLSLISIHVSNSEGTDFITWPLLHIANSECVDSVPNLLQIFDSQCLHFGPCLKLQISASKCIDFVPWPLLHVFNSKCVNSVPNLLQISDSKCIDFVPWPLLHIFNSKCVNSVSNLLQISDSKCIDFVPWPVTCF